MKQGKNPTWRQKKIIAAAKLNPDNWLVTKNLPDEIYLEHRQTGTARILKVKVS